MAASFQYLRYQTTPIIPNGGTYDGWKADALAAPAITFGGSKYVLTCSAWQISTASWSTLFFSSTDLVTWTYMTGSIRTPATGYLLGNGSVIYWSGKYWFVYTDADFSITNGILDYSTDPTLQSGNWTNVSTNVGGVEVNDPGIVLNPYNNKLEIWYVDGSRVPSYMDSPDGSAWTVQGQSLTSPPTWLTGATGEAHAFYLHPDGARYLVMDTGFSSEYTTARLKALFTSAARDTTWTSLGSCLGPAIFSPVAGDSTFGWESYQVFDGMVFGPVEGPNGLGYYQVYAGGDNSSTTNATDSGIGLAFAGAPAPPPPTGVEPWFLERRNFSAGMQRRFGGGMQSCH